MNYTTQAQEVLKLAAESAKLMQHPYIGTEHLLIGLSKIYSGVAGQVLDMNGVKEEDMLKIMNELVTPPEGYGDIRQADGESETAVYLRRGSRRSAASESKRSWNRAFAPCCFK